MAYLKRIEVVFSSSVLFFTEGDLREKVVFVIFTQIFNYFFFSEKSGH